MQRLRRAHRLRREVQRLVLVRRLVTVQQPARVPKRERRLVLAAARQRVQARAMAQQLVQQLLVSARVHRCNQARPRA
jgi:hypothetical protein